MNEEMATFDQAIGTILKNEGGFVDNASDPGGVTNFGMSIRYLKQRGDVDGDGVLDGDLDHDGDIDYADVKNMTREQAMKLYEDIWRKCGAYRLANPVLATKFFDACVNMGTVQATKCLQRAAVACSGTLISDDGHMGPKTLAVISRCTPPMLLACLRSECASFYRLLAAAKPQFKIFIDGWLRRAYQ